MTLSSQMEEKYWQHRSDDQPGQSRDRDLDPFTSGHTFPTATTTNESALQDIESEQRQSRDRNPEAITSGDASPVMQLTVPASILRKADTATLTPVDDASAVRKSKITDHLTDEEDAANYEVEERQSSEADKKPRTPESPALSKTIKTTHTQRTSTPHSSRKKPRLSITVDTTYPRTDFIRSDGPSPPHHCTVTTPRASDNPSNTTNNQSTEAPPSPLSLQQPAPTTPTAEPQQPTTPTRPTPASPHTPTRPISPYGEDGITPPPTQNSRYLRTLRDSDAKARALEASFALQGVIRHGDTVACSHSPPCEGCEGPVMRRREGFDSPVRRRWVQPVGRLEAGDDGADAGDEAEMGKGHKRADSANCGGDAFGGTGWWYKE
ncbi:hypothetical protein H2199_004416 [Coniosporium tulheliwenetii]|uniref:Uncharacterized protein n=1 Tax=Coniosporium tulheliwenetii TaxID=3383036 RepID=A0ACC2Z593_9PEZI|nr:hypothetical protein H2199_004416 [Cladosporium sp. JES 115]